MAATKTKPAAEQAQQPQQPQGPTPEELAERDRLRKEANEQFGSLVGKGRVRLIFGDRKMAVPGRVIKKDGDVILHTNWGADVPLAGRTVAAIEVKDPDSGRFVPRES